MSISKVNTFRIVDEVVFESKTLASLPLTTTALTDRHNLPLIDLVSFKAHTHTLQA